MLERAWKGRGSTRNPAGRFEALAREVVDDGWSGLDELATDPPPKTEVRPDHSRTALAWNDSPDIGFDRSVNPYRGCEHGCIYCYARPSHAHFGLSSGLDFERILFAKHEAAALLKGELAKPGYRPAVVALGSNTDCYQPIERRLVITRAIVGLLVETRHPFAITTKSAGVLRDLDLLREAAPLGIAHVQMSVTTLDPDLARRMEPRASAPRRRLAAVEVLARAGVRVGVNLSPIIPGLTDHEIERLVQAAADAGAVTVSTILVRLPFEVKELFEAWLRQHYPDRAERVLSLIRQCRGGRLNDPGFVSRMRGSGPIADLIRQRFVQARAKHGLDRRLLPLRDDLFRPPALDGQMSLF